MNPRSIVPRTLYGQPVTLEADPISGRLPLAVTESFVVVLATAGGFLDRQFHALVTAGRLPLRKLRSAVASVSQADGGLLPCVICCADLDRGAMEALAREGIPHIKDAGNYFLPFAGVSMETRWVADAPATLSPQAQRIFLNVLAGRWDGRGAGELADLTGRSRASVTNYLSELSAVLPSLVRRAGRAKVVANPGLSKTELLEVFEPYLSSPVIKEHRLRAAIAPDALLGLGARASGETALALYSDLALNSARITVAMTSADVARLRGDPSLGWELAAWHEDAPAVVQEWAYPPDTPGMRGPCYNGLPCVDPESLYASLAGEAEGDVRLADAVDQLREAICR